MCSAANLHCDSTLWKAFNAVGGPGKLFCFLYSCAIDIVRGHKGSYQAMMSTLHASIINNSQINFSLFKFPLTSARRFTNVSITSEVVQYWSFENAKFIHNTSFLFCGHFHGYLRKTSVLLLLDPNDVNSQTKLNEKLAKGIYSS